MWSKDKRTEFLQRGGASANRMLYRLTLDGLRTYLADLEPFLNAQANKEHEAWVAEHGAEMPHWGEYHGGVLPSILRSSFIVALMIEAESFVRGTCDDLTLVTGRPLARDRRRSLIQKAQELVSQTPGLGGPPAQAWADFEIRLAHSQRDRACRRQAKSS